MVIAGPSSLDLHLRSSARDTDLQVTLSEVRPDGNETYVQNGWLRASHRKLDPRRSTSIDPVPTHLRRDAAPLPRGRFSLVRVPIWPVAHAFRAGSRIRVTVEATGGDRPRWQFATVDRGRTRNTVALGGRLASKLVLPSWRARRPRGRRCRRRRRCAASRAGATPPPPTAAEGDAQACRRRYLLANQPSELERLQLQSRVGTRRAAAPFEDRQRIGRARPGRRLRSLGWLRILGEWVGPSGQVVGTDIDESLLDAARSFLEAEGISNVELVVDDLFDSKLEPQSFDLVHARYLIVSARTRPRAGGLAPAAGQAGWLTGPGGVGPGLLALQSPAPAAERLIRLLSEIFAGLGGEAGRGLPELLREIGIEEPEIDAHVIALRPGHPYLRLPLQFSVALESRLLETLSEDELASLRHEAETELAEPGRWGTTFTLIQSWGTLEG